MTDTTRTLLRWSPRTLGLAVALFTSVFALDVFGEDRGASETALALLLHLIPTLLVLAAVAVGWRFPWIGALAFLGLAGLYAATALRRPAWILVVAGPLALVGLLFALSWRYGRGERPATT